VFRKCIILPNTHCYVRGSFTAKPQRRTNTRDFQKFHQLYYSCPLLDQDKDWVPHVLRTSCSNGLLDWMHKRKTAVSFAISMIWQDPKNHVDDCYFCCVIVTGFSAKNKLKILHHNVNPTITPIPYDDNLRVPKPLENGLAFLE
jgi:hypothetical protein